MMSSPPQHAEHREAIRQAVDIVEVIGSRLSLRKSGKNFVGLCPFHQEKSPSFSVSPSKKVYHCFGCHVGGDIFDFVMRYEGLTFHAAMLQLGQACGIQVAPLSPARQRQQQLLGQLAAVNATALAFFHRALQRPEGAAARAYLKARQLPPELVQARRLGFGHHTAAFLAYMAEHGCTLEQCFAAGLLSDDQQHLLFAGRVIFPIYNRSGQVAGFGGRHLTSGQTASQKAAPKAPKYINSRDSSLFDKSQLLYGIDVAYAGIRQQQSVIIMEGYTDVLAAQRAQLNHAVAVLGTSLTVQHAQTLQKIATTALICLDGDAAGRRAAYKSSLVLLQAGLKTTLAQLPQGHDPDSLVCQRGAAALRQVLANAVPAVEFFMERAFAADQPKGRMSIEDRAQAARGLQPLLASLGPGLSYDLYMERLSQRVGLGRAQLAAALQQASDVEKAKAARRRRSPSAAASTASATALRTPPVVAASQAGDNAVRLMPAPYEMELLRELCLYPGLRARFGEIADYAITPQMRHLLEALAEPQSVWESVLRQNIPDARWCQRLLAIKPCQSAPQEGAKAAFSDVAQDDEQHSVHTFEAVRASFKRRHLDSALHDVFSEMQQFEARGEATDMLMRRKQELTARKRALKNAPVFRVGKPADPLSSDQR